MEPTLQFQLYIKNKPNRLIHSQITAQSRNQRGLVLLLMATLNNISKNTCGSKFQISCKWINHLGLSWRSKWTSNSARKHSLVKGSSSRYTKFNNFIQVKGIVDLGYEGVSVTCHKKIDQIMAWRSLFCMA